MQVIANKLLIMSRLNFRLHLRIIAINQPLIRIYNRQNIILHFVESSIISLPILRDIFQYL
jgi:hypothetical protein